MKYECDLIRDLMPLCADGMASETSQKIMQEHLSECSACSAEWEDIRNAAKTFPETEVPEETKKFAKAARRVKKQHIRLLVIAVLTTAIVLGGVSVGMTIGYEGARLSPQQAAVTGLKRNRIADSFSYVWTDHPEYENESICFLRFTNEQTGQPMMISVFTFKAGLWWCFGGILGDMQMPAEQGVYTVTHPLVFQYTTGSYYWVDDPAVAEITITCGEERSTVQTAEYPDGICPVYLPHSYRSTANELTGAAYDADGNVLYTMQNGEWQHE